MPVLNAPAYKQINAGAAFGEVQYMSGVSATDIEDGNITSKVTHNSPVNRNAEGYYRVSYQVTDKDRNTAKAETLVFVGPWIIRDGYAINAANFTKRVSQVRGTDSEMISSAKAQAICVDKNSPSYGRAVPLIVKDDGGYAEKKAGSFKITFAVQADIGITKTITATVTKGTVPVLTVPSIKTVPEGGAFSYTQGVSANDAEDGDITTKVIFDRPVDTGKIGAYKVIYMVTDSDGNTVTKSGSVLVGDGWVRRGSYAIYAQSFTRRLSQITGTGDEALRLAKARAVWIADANSPEFAKYVPVKIVNDGGYKRKAGEYNIKFAISEKTSVTKTIRATITSAQAPPAPNPPQVVRPVVNVTTPAPQTQIINNPAPVIESQPQQPPVVNVPAPQVTVEQPPAQILEPVTPLANTGRWHLIDLILAIVAMALGFYLLIFAMRRREDDEYDEEYAGSEKTYGKRVRMWGQLGVILGITAVIILLLTQKFAGEMALVDIWAIVFALIVGVEALATVGVTSSKRREWSMEREA
jgi:hypothetical protein